MTAKSPIRNSVLVAGGGTAGHLLPGLSVARELVERGQDPSTIHFAGSVNGPEANLVPEAGFGVTLLPGRGIQRKLTVENLGAVWGLLRSIGQSFRLVRKRKPDVVLVLGGFASAAVGLAAIVTRVPVVVADQNARAGAVNRLVGRFAAACAVPFPDTDLPKATVTGNPVREEILSAAAARNPEGSAAELGMSVDRTRIGVVTGSLGSQRVNRAVVDAVRDDWAERSDLSIYHVIGVRDFDGDELQVPPTQSDAARVEYRPVRYEEHPETLLDACDLVVSRAGGTTVAELAVMGSPSVLIPLPIATRDHQSANALELVRVGAAVMVPDSELTKDRLVSEVDALVQDPGRLEVMASAAAATARTDAAAAVADLLVENAR